MIMKIAHRGASGYEPENTLLAFKKAIELKADMIELDVHKCKSGELVVIHDHLFEKTMHGKGFIEELDYKTLRKLHGRKNQYIPLLTEVLDLVDKRVKVNIELKSRGITQDVVGVIHDHIDNKGWTYDHFLVSSFDHHAIFKLLKLDPKIKRGVLIIHLPLDYTDGFKKLKPYSIEPGYKFVNKDFVKNAHKNKMKVFVWTVNNKQHIAKIKRLGVDGIFSDYPDRI